MGGVDCLCLVCTHVCHTRVCSSKHETYNTIQYNTATSGHASMDLVNAVRDGAARLANQMERDDSQNKHLDYVNSLRRQQK